jgi:hypothetical protein
MSDTFPEAYLYYGDAICNKHEHRRALVCCWLSKYEALQMELTRERLSDDDDEDDVAHNLVPHSSIDFERKCSVFTWRTLSQFNGFPYRILTRSITIKHSTSPLHLLLASNRHTRPTCLLCRQPFEHTYFVASPI